MCPDTWLMLVILGERVGKIASNFTELSWWRYQLPALAPRCLFFL